VGAMPGRVVQSIRRAGVNNPVMMLDEIDKLGADYRGDPAAALLEILDPEQNNTFTDHYLDLPFDLSKVLFIATANQLGPIPPPLRDRMDIIPLAGYSDREKLEIAKRYLAPRQIRENGLKPEQIEIADSAITLIATRYTREAGVRQLERSLGRVGRKVALRIAQGQTEKVLIDADGLFGPEELDTSGEFARYMELWVREAFQKGVSFVTPGWYPPGAANVSRPMLDVLERVANSIPDA